MENFAMILLYKQQPHIMWSFWNSRSHRNKLIDITYRKSIKLILQNECVCVYIREMRETCEDKQAKKIHDIKNSKENYFW